MEIKLKMVGYYNGHAIKTNKIIDLSFKFKYDEEIVNVIKLLQLINENIEVGIKANGNIIRLGLFQIKNISFDKNGECNLKLFSQIDYVENLNINYIVDDGPITVLFKSKITESEDEINENNSADS